MIEGESPLAGRTGEESQDGITAMNRLKLAFAVLMPACIACGTMHVTDKADFINGENTNGWTFSENQWRSPAYPVPVASFTATGTNLSDGAALTVS